MAKQSNDFMQQLKTNIIQNKLMNIPTSSLSVGIPLLGVATATGAAPLATVAVVSAISAPIISAAFAEGKRLLNQLVEKISPERLEQQRQALLNDIHEAKMDTAVLANRAYDLGVIDTFNHKLITTSVDNDQALQSLTSRVENSLGNKLSNERVFSHQPTSHNGVLCPSPRK